MMTAGLSNREIASTLGISEQSIFPEIELDKIKRSLGFDVTFVTNTDNDDYARALLRALGMPFVRTKAQLQKAAEEKQAA